MREKGEANHIKHGFILSFYFLLKSSQYEGKYHGSFIYMLAMRFVCRLGGDIANNCSIVGGMIGAVIGIFGIPPYMW